MSTLRIWGCPAEALSDGNLPFSCQDRPGRFPVDASDPVLRRIGRTVNGGAPSGGWFMARADKALELVGDRSIGPSDAGWLAVPPTRLGGAGTARHAGRGRGS